jgi:hypothetical protein
MGIVNLNPRVAAWMSGAGIAAMVTDYRNNLQPFRAPVAHAVFISDFPKITRQLCFFGCAVRSGSYNVLLGKDLDFPKFGIPPVIHRYRRHALRDADIFGLIV